MAKTLLDKVWDAHTVRTLPSGQTQLLIGLHLIHEVTTPQAFQMLKDSKLKVRMPERTFGTLDHIIPTTDQTRPYADPLAEEMAVHMIRNAKDYGVPLFDMSTGKLVWADNSPGENILDGEWSSPPIGPTRSARWWRSIPMSTW